jgi:uncharacterized protein YaaN involved in tellurite resistance
MTGTPASLTAPDATLTLTPPEAVAPVATTAAPGLAPIDKAALPGLDAKVATYVDQLLDAAAGSPEFAAKSAEVLALGDTDIRDAASSSNRLLQAKLRTRSGGVAGSSADIAETLTELRRTVEDLDPADATGVRKLLGIIPFGNKLAAYFQKFESAQDHLDAIIKALQSGADELRKDNAALDVEKQHLWAAMQRLNQYAYIAAQLDTSLNARINELDATDPTRAAALRQDVLFYVRQKHQDLLTQLAVSIQGYLAIDMIRRNNLELIKGVDRATTTTVSALRTAVIVAQALANQKLVLDQIDALNTTTSRIIQSTSQLLAQQTGQIHQQAASSTVSIDALKAAFANVYQAMDAIDTFKTQALDTMAQTVTALETEIAGAQTYVERARRTSDSTVDGVLTLDTL